MSLSDKVIGFFNEDVTKVIGDRWEGKDIREAVKELKDDLGEDVLWRSEAIKEMIDRSFGEKLCR